MKTKLQIIIACFLILTSYTAKSQNIIAGYNDNDIQKLQTFFAKTDGTTTNGVKINASYLSTDPTTWSGVTWNNDAIKRVTQIVLSNLQLAGSFDCSKFDSLTYINININKLTSVDFSDCNSLNSLTCQANNITNIDISGCSNLGDLRLSSNELKTLDLSGNANLKALSFSNNQIPSVDLSGVSIVDLLCNGNQLKFSDIKYSSSAYRLLLSPQSPFIPLGVNNNMSANAGTTINLSAEANVSPNGTPVATTFHVWKKAANATITDVTANCNINNGLITLPSSGQTGDSLFITMSNSTYPDFVEGTTPATALSSGMRTKIFALVNNIITGYNDNDVQKLQAFFAKTDGTTTNGVKINSAYSSTDPTTWSGITWNNDSNKRVTKIDLTNLQLVGSFDCSNFDSLTIIHLYVNQITSLNVSGCSNLTSLECHSNQLTSLDLSGCSMLTGIFCYNNHLTSLDLSGCSNLNSLSCNNNELTSLDLSRCSIKGLFCQNNQLTSLDLSGNIPLTYLECYNNQLKFSDMKYKPSRHAKVSPQSPFIPLGVTTTNNNMVANAGTTIDLSAEANVSSNGTPVATTFHVWKKAANATITDVTANCNINNGLITLPSSGQTGDSLFITMSNSTYPDFVEGTTPATALSSGMRTKIFALVNNIITGYNDNDVQKLQAFFAKTDGTTTNGVKINSAYSSTNPTTWSGVTWDNSFVKRVTEINLTYLQLVGSFDCSNFNSLTDLNFTNNQLTSLDVSGCNSLSSLFCETNIITSLNISGCSNLGDLRCSDNQLTSLDLSGCSMLNALSCGNNQLKFSDIQNNSPQIVMLNYSPQRSFIPIGVDTANNSMSAIGGDTINLSSEVNVGPTGSKALTTFTVWKKANDGTISEITNICVIDSGKIVLPNTYTENDSVFITMSNANFPDFTTQTTPIIPDANTMRTITFKWLSSSSVLPTENNKTVIKIYPNPATDQISVTGNEEDLNSVKIYNSLGQDVTKYTNYSVSNTKQIKIDISKLTTGIYILKTKNTTNRLVVK